MIKPGLERISRLLKHTSLSWPAIHVAGTNGKGSVCAYISSMLEAFSKSTYAKEMRLQPLTYGRFTSPHLIDRWDCISINNQPVSSSLFRALEKKVIIRDRTEKISASEFETLTATAFKVFNTERIDVGVVEVGMGGAGDATNVIGLPFPEELHSFWHRQPRWQAPLVSVITKIGMDHQSFLGDSLEEIARQKAGILKPGVPVIFDPSNAPEVKEVIHQEAEMKNCPVYSDDRFPFLVPKSTEDLVLSCSWNEATDHVSKAFAAADLPAPPQHVETNATLALMATNVALHRLHYFAPLYWPENRIKDRTQTLEAALINLRDAMLAAISATEFPGRQQNIDISALDTGRITPILLDGAHNSDSALALADKVNHMRQQAKGKPVTWVLAASDSKDAADIFRPLLRPGDTAVLVEFGPVDGMPWVKPTSVDQLEDAVDRALQGNGGGATPGDRKVKVIRAGNEIRHALQEATFEAWTGYAEGPLVAAGSLYLVGDVLRLLRDAQRQSASSEKESGSAEG